MGRKGGRSGGFGLYGEFGRPLTDSACEPDFAYLSNNLQTNAYS